MFNMEYQVTSFFIITSAFPPFYPNTNQTMLSLVLSLTFWKCLLWVLNERKFIKKVDNVMQSQHNIYNRFFKKMQQAVYDSNGESMIVES